jgi:hypothetical protein
MKLLISRSESVPNLHHVCNGFIPSTLFLTTVAVAECHLQRSHESTYSVGPNSKTWERRPSIVINSTVKTVFINK